MPKPKPEKAAKMTETPVSIRMHPRLLDDADELVPMLADDPELSTVAGGANRSAVLRLALVEGLKLLRRRWSKGGKHD